jgi:hypothetical protein
MQKLHPLSEHYSELHSDQRSEHYSELHSNQRSDLSLLCSHAVTCFYDQQTPSLLS